MLVDFSLDGKVAIVTGAAVGGIGEAYAKALAEAGAAVACFDVNDAGAKGVADAIVADGGRALALAADITSDESVRDAVGRTVDELGGVDILVNNAALMATLVAAGGTLDFPPEMWNQAFAVNVTGAWNCARAVVPEMVKRGGGSIVNQSSIGAGSPPRSRASSARRTSTSTASRPVSRSRSPAPRSHPRVRPTSR
jgi:NAD(P)-dependent dehydrogenase (short-subunit alcohol dehydrogenase family)